jgi:hypothetical protein
VLTAAAVVAPRGLSGAEAASEADVFAAADDPELSAVNHALAARLEAVAVRTAMKDDLVQQLVNGRLSLAAAAGQFLDLNSQSPDCLSVMRAHFPGRTDTESAARNVIEYARHRTPAGRAEQVADRLAAEFRAMYPHAAD